MRVLVTGGAGMLARDVADAAAVSGHEVIAPARAELDILDAGALRAAVERKNPDVVINCAAYTRVDDAESEPKRAHAVNEKGAANVAAAAAAAGAAVVYPSSDYVFDGRADTPYVESDETNPLSAYGRSKLAGERATADANPRHFIARTAWLFGTGGGNFVETMLKLARTRDEIAVVDDQVGSPTWTAHLAAGLMRLIETDAYGVHHVASAGATSWNGFAHEIFRRAGVRVRVTPASTESMGRPAPRPEFSALASERREVMLPDWKVGLVAYLEARGA